MSSTILKTLTRHYGRFASLLLLCCCCNTVTAQRIGLKTNVLYWAAATPNLGLEFRLNRHLTLNMEGAFNNLKAGSIDTRLEMGSAEMRYWFSARPQAGHFVGLTGMAGNYNVLLKHTHHDGDAIGGGLTYGYSFVLSRHWSIETTIGAGMLRMREKRYNETEQAPTTPTTTNGQLLRLKPVSHLYT